MATLNLFHGSKEVVSEIHAREDRGFFSFGGIFASADRFAAESHGDNLHTVEVDDQEVANNSDLWYTWNSVPAERRAMIKAIKSETNAKTKAQVERVFELAADDVNPEDADWNLYKNADCFASASWGNQRIRGAIAKAVGFRAVEMDDEHGISYLVIGGVGTKISVAE